MNFVRTFYIAFISAGFLFVSLCFYYVWVYVDNGSRYSSNDYGDLLGIVFIVSLLLTSALHFWITMNLVHKSETGKWIFMLYVPLINIAVFLLCIPLIGILKIPMFNDPNDYALGMLLMLYLPWHWFVFVAGVLAGHFRKTTNRNYRAWFVAAGMALVVLFISIIMIIFQ
ncbi:hypothetical protein [Anoxybacteroides tepidamans]|uniref:hypothetical protein n=1 Tax=Anoxybacteroides tepidamans TaxID=265948 RepID=UPI000484318C|nr:hypothetical protein [Anoxybacillus tepidamans]